MARLSTCLVLALLAAWGLSSEAFAQGGGPNARDIFGIWGRADRLFTLSVDPPPRTAWGEEKFNSYKPSYGPRAIPPALGNDPQGNCDPLGIPRTLFLENNPGAFEFIQVPGRVLQIFERHHVWREIWTDGRELPKDAEPRWMGYSVGRWEGDTFVVNSVGFDERTWLDHFGNPHSDEMRLEERYRRADANTMEFTLKIDDPKTYTRPWMSDKKIVRLQPARAFEELFCVPSEEQAFNKRIRDPAGGIIRP